MLWAALVILVGTVSLTLWIGGGDEDSRAVSGGILVLGIIAASLAVGLYWDREKREGIRRDAQVCVNDGGMPFYGPKRYEFHCLKAEGR